MYTHLHINVSESGREQTGMNPGASVCGCVCCCVRGVMPRLSLSLRSAPPPPSLLCCPSLSPSLSLSYLATLWGSSARTTPQFQRHLGTLFCPFADRKGVLGAQLGVVGSQRRAWQPLSLGLVRGGVEKCLLASSPTHIPRPRAEGG